MSLWKIVFLLAVLRRRYQLFCLLATATGITTWRDGIKLQAIGSTRPRCKEETVVFNLVQFPFSVNRPSSSRIALGNPVQI